MIPTSNSQSFFSGTEFASDKTEFRSCFHILLTIYYFPYILQYGTKYSSNKLSGILAPQLIPLSNTESRHEKWDVS